MFYLFTEIWSHTTPVLNVLQTENLSNSQNLPFKDGSLPAPLEMHQLHCNPQHSFKKRKKIAIESHAVISSKEETIR